jgi:type IV secretory pathway TrbD component
MAEGSNYDDAPPGYEVPVHQSLTKQLMLAGVPRGLAIIIWTFCVALSLPLRTWYAIPLTLFLHAVFYRAAKRDPDFWDVFRRAIRYKIFYRA